MGNETTVKCKRCNGNGTIETNIFTGKRETCPTCGGAGVVKLR